ncbi:MAG: bifunctional ADP-dependent NAD(P)H-hydrate dehydratase/NAD(P)H-hydrate epimerase, partial [Acutalibacter sp.]|nr:bifunctional ADP-dependent NAD(P)H-hydrate dehydratase/NAD(P)H-hydrate epimerase [Acutalibacter sp.]
PTGALALNPTGNPGMAKGGSGDVLAGVVGALLAQGVQPFSAAWAGAWLHGRAGDLCQRRLSARAMLPTDLTEALPEILKEFESLPPLYKRDII